MSPAPADDQSPYSPQEELRRLARQLDLQYPNGGLRLIEIKVTLSDSERTFAVTRSGRRHQP